MKQPIVKSKRQGKSVMLTIPDEFNISENEVI